MSCKGKLPQLVKLACIALLTTSFSTELWSGPFPPAAGQAGSTAIASNDSSIVDWAQSVVNYSVGANVSIEFQTPEKALGEAGSSDGSSPDFTFDIVSLGSGGQITLTFNPPIADGDGFDFAIFENSFSAGFLELAYVEVSSNGVDFMRFPIASLTPNPIGPFSSNMNTTDILGFAGKYAASFGTPFDLSELADESNIDKSAIAFVRLVDVIGDGRDTDDLPGNNPIYDPFPTSGSAGFDLDAIAVLNQGVEAIPADVNVPLPPWIYGVFAAVFLSIFRLYKK